MNPDYKQPDSKLTLRQGLDEYFRMNPHLLIPEDNDPETKGFFHNHDCIHVVFGCDTSFLDEARTDFWTFFSVDIGFFEYVGVLFKPPIQQLYKDLKENATPESTKALRQEMLRNAWKIPFIPIQTFLLSRRMKKKWPRRDHEQYMDRPLCDIRKEFGIQIS